MFRRPEAAENDFRANRNRRKSRLGKHNVDVDKPIPLPRSFVPRRTMGCRMNQVLYQEAAIKRKTEAAKTHPKKCLFSEPTDENSDHHSFKVQESAPHSTRFRLSSVEDPDVTGVFPIEDKTKQFNLGADNMAPPTSGRRLPLKNHNFQYSTATTIPSHHLFKNFSNGTAITDSARKCLSKKPAPWNWNAVPSPVMPKLSSFPGSKTPRAQQYHIIQSPIMPRLSTFPHTVKSAIKISVIPPETSGENEIKAGFISKTITNDDLSGNCRSKGSDSNFPVNGGSNDSDVLTFSNFKFPVTGESKDSRRAQTKSSNFNFPVTGESNSGSDMLKSPNFNHPVGAGRSKDSSFDSSNVYHPVPGKLTNVYSNKDESRYPTAQKDMVASFKTRSPLNEKTNRLKEKQKKMSLSEIEFEKMCKMRCEGSPMQTMNFLGDLCVNGKSRLEQNKEGIKKEVNEISRAKETTTKNCVRRSISSINNPNENVQHSKLKQPQCFVSKVEKKIQPSGSEFNRKQQSIDESSPKFVIRKCKESLLSTDTFDDADEDSFNNYNNITNNYESSTLIVNDRGGEVVDSIDDALSSIQLNEVGETFVVPRKLFDDKFCEDGASNVDAPIMNEERNHNVGETFVIQSNNTSRKVLFHDKKFCNENGASILKVSARNDEINQSVDLGVNMLNESLDTTLKFVENETLCNNEDDDATLLASGVKSAGTTDDVKRYDVEGMDGNRMKEVEKVVKRIGEETIDNLGEVEVNTQSLSQNCYNAASVLLSNDSEKKEPHDLTMTKLLEKHRLLVQKGKDLFSSRKQIFSQIKVLEKSLVEQEQQFNELNSEFCDLFREFGEVVVGQQQRNDTVSVSKTKINDTVSACVNNNDTVSSFNNGTVSETVVVPFTVSKPTFDTPRSTRRVRRNLVFSQLKSEFSCLKTPLPSTTKKLQESFANKTILTPKSMSVCIQDQVNQLFDS